MVTMRARTLALAAAGAISALAVAAPAHAAGEAGPLLHHEWEFDGVFGTFNRESAQRGYQIYREVCAACHSMEYIAFRNLTALGYTEDQAKAFAAEYQITDGPDDYGDMFERTATLSDYFPSPYPNEQAARAANGGAYPPDLSLITKARGNGPDYVYSLMQGYVEPAGDVELAPGQYYNEYYPGHKIAMPQQLWEDGITYMDGTYASIEQQSIDIVNFLHWAAEPKLEERKQTGLKAMVFLAIFTALAYATYRKVWGNIEH